MENPEEILQSLEEFSKFRPKDIPRELEEYLSFVAKTGDPVYQWSSIKQLFKEKLTNVVNEFYESCPLIDIPPCPNVEAFNYDTMKSFILEKLETFSAAPFTLQRICELLTTPRKEYNRIDKFMRALEKNILVVSTVEPGCKNTENGESIVNGLESEHLPESSNCSTDINVVEMEESPVWPKTEQVEMQFQNTDEVASTEALISEVKENDKESPSCSSSQDSVITERESEDQLEVTINSSLEESTEKLSPVEINVETLPRLEEEVTSEPVVSSEVLDEVTESEAVSSNYSKEEQENPEESNSNSETTLQEDLKQADSTTNSKPLITESIPIVCSIEVKECSGSIKLQETNCEIASSEPISHSDSNEGSTSVDFYTANESLTSTDYNTVNDEASNDSVTELIESNIAVTEHVQNVIYDEDSNLSPADTTKGYERQLENNFENKIEDNKDEEITSSDKVVVAVPSTSIDDISDDESEAEAELQKGDQEVICDNADALLDKETVENDSVVTASSDDMRKDCGEAIPMEVDSKEKADFNEAEATCESI